ncbi:MAG: PAS domain-containing protein, partial [Calditrichaeota bacterium]|nr:PAS domain-containing protein [Calditrichota bacterium]
MLGLLSSLPAFNASPEEFQWHLQNLPEVLNVPAALLLYRTATGAPFSAMALGELSPPDAPTLETLSAAIDRSGYPSALSKDRRFLANLLPENARRWQLYTSANQLVALLCAIGAKSPHKHRSAIAFFLNLLEQKLPLGKPTATPLLVGLWDAIPDPLYFKDRHGIFRDCNQAFAETHRLTRREILGRNAPQLFGDSALPLLAEEEIVLHDGHEKKFRERIPRPDG